MDRKRAFQILKREKRREESSWRSKDTSPANGLGITEVDHKWKVPCTVLTEGMVKQQDANFMNATLPLASLFIHFAPGMVADNNKR